MTKGQEFPALSRSPGRLVRAVSAMLLEDPSFSHAESVFLEDIGSSPDAPNHHSNSYRAKQ